MGLIDLRTNLKSLRYGKDKIGGGSSNQPFIQKPIPESFDGVGNTGGLDVLNRGGSLAIGRTADDVSRLSKLLLTPATFQGPFFSVKQNILSRQGVKTQASTSGLNEGIYLPTSTLAQVGVSAAGLHLNKQGINPIPGTFGSIRTYSDIVDSTFISEGIKSTENNRLVKLTDSFINKKSGNILYSYTGGPGSVLGIGKTNIYIPADQRTGINTTGTTLDGFFGKEGIKNPIYSIYEQLAPPDIETPSNNNIPEYLISPVPALKYKSFTNPRPVELDYRRYLSLSYNAGVAGVESQQIRDNVAFKQNSLITLKTAPKGTKSEGISINVNSNYAIEAGLTTNNNYELFTPVISSTGLYLGNKPSAKEKAMGTTPFTGDIELTKPTLESRNQTQTLENLESYTFTSEQLKIAPSYRTTGQIQDFRTVFRGKGGNAKAVGADILAPSYISQNIETRVHLGDPGKKGDVSNFTAGKKDLIQGKNLGPVDKLNAITLYKSDTVRLDNKAPVNDLVQFRIAVLDPDGSNDKTYIHFRAFLNSIEDNYSSELTSHRYVGRGENFWTYQGFDRNISLSWTVYAQSKEELIPMYKRLNYLASTLAPNYKNGFMRGVICQLTVGGYLYEQPGYIKGFSYELTEDTTWEIGINTKGFSESESTLVRNRGDYSVKELPHMIKITGFQFIPIHNFIPEIQNNEYKLNGDVATYGKQRYIALSNGRNGTNYQA